MSTRSTGATTETPAALAGLKVADFSWAAAGPISTKNLADHGAIVVRVESATRPDSIRITPPFRDDVPGINKSGFFADFNSSKYDLALNLKLPAAQPIAQRLIAWADVVVESFTPHVMSDMRLGYDDIVVWKPDVVMLSSCLQGHTGPFREYAGYGVQGAALAGLHFVSGWADREPAGPKGAYTDSIAPHYAVSAILAALDYRDRTGLGQYIDLAQVECALSGFLGPEILDYTVNGCIAQRRGNRDPYAAPHGSFPCAGDDQWITIAVETDAHWAALLAVLGNPDWGLAERFATLTRRLEHQDELEAELGNATRNQDVKALVERLLAVDVPAAHVQKAADLFADPQLVHRNHFRPLEHAEMGIVAYNGPAHELSETPAVLQWAAPLLGEHTHYVMRDILGYLADEIAAFDAQHLLE